MEKKQGFRIHSFILFLLVVLSGGYLVYLQIIIKSEDINSKLLSLVVFIVAMYFAMKNWVIDNPEKNKKNWSGEEKNN